MTPEEEEAVQQSVDAFNALADMLVERADGDAADALKNLLTLSPLIHYHGPWDTAFVVVVDDEPWPVVSEARDAWFVSDGLPRRLDCKKVGSDPPVKGFYRPLGASGPAIDLEWHPVEGEPNEWRAVAPDESAIPHIRLAMLSFSDSHPKPPGDLP